MPYHHDNTKNNTNNLESSTNAESRLAPAGFHYMPDGSLMADSEMGSSAAESRVSSTSICNPCGVVYVDNSALGPGGQFMYLSSLSATPVTLTMNGISNWLNWDLRGWSTYPEIAKHEDKIYLTGYKPQQKAIIELTLSANCDELTLSRIMPFSCSPYPDYVFNFLVCSVAKNSTTLIGTMQLAPSSDPLGQWRVIEIDVSGVNAVGVELYLAPTGSGTNFNGTGTMWDMVYISDNNSIVGANHLGDVTWFDYASGNIIDQKQYSSGGVIHIISYGMFCVREGNEGKVYLAGASSPMVGNKVFEVDLSGGSIYIDTAGGTLYSGVMSDAASSSSCCITEEPPCTLIDVMDAAVATVHPVYLTSTNPNISGAILFSNFTQNMWNHYTGVLSGPTGCDWWWNKWTHWTGQMPGVIAQNNPYQIALKTAKINFAEEMIIACGCDPQSSPDNVNSYNCVNGKCVLVSTTAVGQFTSLSACETSCGSGGWNCTTINGEKIGTYQSCVEVGLPAIGAYPTLSACKDGFINKGMGPCGPSQSHEDADEMSPELHL